MIRFSEFYWYCKLMVGLWVFSAGISVLFTGTIMSYHIIAPIVILPYSVLWYILSMKFRYDKYLSHKVLLIAASLCINFLMVIITNFVLETENGFPFLSLKDDYLYDISAKAIASRWEVNGLGFYSDIRFSTGFYSGFPNWSALLMFFFGDSHLVPRFGNAVCLTGILIVTYRIIGMENHLKTASKWAIIIGLSPVLLLYASFQLKDIVLLLLISICILSVGQITLNRGGLVKWFAILALTATGMIFFRAAVLFPIIGGYVLMMIFVKSDGKILLYRLILVALAFSGLVFIWDSLSSLNVLGGYNYYLESRYDTVIEGDAYRGTNLMAIANIKIFLLPLFVLFSLFLPVPLVVELPESVLNYNYYILVPYLALLPIAIHGIRFLWINRKDKPFGIFILCFLVIYKVMQANGSSVLDSRQSLPALYCLMVITAYRPETETISSPLKWRESYLMSVSIILLLIFMFSVGRLYIRGLI